MIQIRWLFAALEQGDLAEFNQCLAVLQDLYSDGVNSPHHTPRLHAKFKFEKDSCAAAVQEQTTSSRNEYAGCFCGCLRKVALAGSPESSSSVEMTGGDASAGGGE